MSKKKAISEKHIERSIDRYLSHFSRYHQQARNRYLFYLTIPLLLFAIAGLIWFIPFPRLTFLGAYQGYFNWFTIFMAIIIYAYLKLSPTLSYAMLFTFGICSYLLVQLEYWEKGGGPTPWLVCLLIGCLAIGGQLLGYRREGIKVSLGEFLRFLFIGPLWLWSHLFKRMRIPF